MSHRHLHIGAMLLALASWLSASSARAWVETRIRSHAAVVDLGRDGTALVSHEIVLKVRGGPLRSLSVDGVDEDADILPDARVESLGAANGEWPLLLHKSDDGVLSIEVDDKQGLRAGVYSFRFTYRTNFLARDLFRERGPSVELAWVGPRLADGVDSAKATFRVPKADTVPRLPERRDQTAAEDSSDLLVSELRRGPDKDELVLVRAHVAKGEPALWTVAASARSFDAFTPPPGGVEPGAGSDARSEPGLRALWLSGALLLALVYALLVGFKWSIASKVAKLKQSVARPLIPIPMALRVALSGALLGGAFLTAVNAADPTLAGALLVMSMLLAAQLPPRTAPTMRGPGRWVASSKVPPVAATGGLGRFFDAGTWPGFLLFSACLAIFLGASLWLLPRAPYHAVLTLLGSVCLLPVFCTGRGAELPPDAVARPRRFFVPLLERLRAVTGARVTLLGRIPELGQTPDELRLLVEPKLAPHGLLALELGLEYQVASSSVVDLPCLLVRALDDSPAYFALPRGVVWSRGRTNSERVALLRPALPTRASCVRLVQQVIEVLEIAEKQGRRQGEAASKKQRCMSSGRPISTSKSAIAAPTERM